MLYKFLLESREFMALPSGVFLSLAGLFTDQQSMENPEAV
jgi:hypothetical protein